MSDTITLRKETEEKKGKILTTDPDRIYIDMTKTRMFLLGTLTGAALSLFFVSTIVMVAAYDPRTDAIYQLVNKSYPMFRSAFLLSFAALCYGAAMFVWRRKQIDFHRVFQMNPAIKYEIMLDAGYSTAICIFFFFGYYMLALLFPTSIIIVPYSNLAPFFALLAPFVMLFWPSDRTPLFFRKHKGSLAARRALFFDLLGPVLFAPFAEATFARCFVADVMCSMPKILADFASAFFWVFTLTKENPQRTHNQTLRHVKTMLEVLPFFARFSQSIRLVFSYKQRPHLKKNALNAFKYFSAINLTIASVAKTRKLKTFFGYGHADWTLIWLFLSVYCTCFNLVWDVFMDWGLPRKGRFQPIVYAIAVAIDAILRLGWAIYVSPEQNVLQQHLVLILGAAEIMRRFMWAVFRIEYEDLKTAPDNNNDEQADQENSLLPAVVYPARGRRHSTSLLETAYSSTTLSSHSTPILPNDNDNVVLSSLDSPGGSLGFVVRKGQQPSSSPRKT